MISINTNLSSLITQRSLTKSTDALNLAIERMTTGFKINHAKDNAANYSISTNLTTKISSYMVAEENASMGLDMLSSANGTLDQITDKLERLRALATQASNGTYGAQSLNAINSEASALVDEINRLYTTAEYNGINLFSTPETTPVAATFATPREIVVDEEKRVSKIYDEGGDFISGETYYICDASDLVALSTLTNDPGLYSTANVTFELTSDINMDGTYYEGIGVLSVFEGTFNGNGHTISNLESEYGLFVDTEGATIDSVILKDVTVENYYYAGGLVCEAADTTITNCAVIGSSVYSSNVGAGGLVGKMSSGSISNSYSTASVESRSSIAGGLVAWAENNVQITNSYATGNVYSDQHMSGGLVAWAENNVQITNSYATGNVYSGLHLSGGLVGYTKNNIIANSYATGSTDGGALICQVVGNLSGTGNYYNSETGLNPISYNKTSNTMTCEGKTLAELQSPALLELMGYTTANGWRIENGVPVLMVFDPPAPNTGAPAGAINFQIGIHSCESSNITLNLGFALDGINDLYGIGLDNEDYLTKIDDLLSVVSNKATEYGAAQNRLESALEEIATQYENLVSTRSTIRDADIAEVSSQYIQQQILQQASATLMATANQMPAIALQLI